MISISLNIRLNIFDSKDKHPGILNHLKYIHSNVKEKDRVGAKYIRQQEIISDVL